jgi:hypothetical protein
LSQYQFLFDILSWRILNFQLFLFIAWFWLRLALPGQALARQPPLNAVFEQFRHFDELPVLASSGSNAKSECRGGDRVEETCDQLMNVFTIPGC